MAKSELQVAKEMQTKGYRYIAQLVGSSGPIGDPMYFKTSLDLSNMLRTEYPNARVKFNRKIEDFIKEAENAEK